MKQNSAIVNPEINKIVSTILRAGNRHGLSDDVVSDELISIIKIIRFKYSSTVPIIVKFDAGFLDKTLPKSDDLGVRCSMFYAL